MAMTSLTSMLDPCGIGTTGEQAGSQSSEQDRQECAGFQDRIAADHFAGIENLRAAARTWPGRRKVECTPIMNSANNSSSTQCCAKPIPATIMIAISSALTLLRMRALSKRSPNWPASPENTTKGRMNRPAAMFSPAIPGVAAAPAGGLIGDEYDQHVLEKVVVERTTGLGHEERQEAPFAQEPELVGCAHDC